MKKLVVVFITCLGFYCAQGQSPIESISGEYTYVNPDTVFLSSLPEDLLQLEDRLIMLHLSFGATEGISKLAVAAGSSEGSNDLFYKEFSWGQGGDFDDGTYYHTTGSMAEIGIGVFSGLPRYYLGVYCIKADGSLSEGVNYLMD